MQDRSPSPSSRVNTTARSSPWPSAASAGRRRLARAEVLIAGHRPHWLISAGFAGALNPAYARNDLVVAREVIDREGKTFVVDPPAKMGASVHHARGRLLTVDRVILRAADKADLHRSYQADLVDMESSAVAGVCHEKPVRFLSIRVISDDAHGDLPEEIMSIMNPSGVYRVGATLRSLWRRPSSPGISGNCMSIRSRQPIGCRNSSFAASTTCLTDPLKFREGIKSNPAVSLCRRDNLSEARCRFGSLRERHPGAASRPRMTRNALRSRPPLPWAAPQSAAA